jgi:Threonine synthase
MRYYSLNNSSPLSSFKKAVQNGIAPDRGLYFPEKITPISEDFINNINDYSNEEIAYEVIKQFIGDEIPTNILKEIIKKTISFDFPVVNLDDNIGSLELFHGPTMAFNDVGASLCLNA